MLSQEVEIPCPYCQRKVKQTRNELQKDARIACPGCHRKILIGGAGFEAVAVPAKRSNGVARKLTSTRAQH